jgi:hypothetical protein
MVVVYVPELFSYCYRIAVAVVQRLKHLAIHGGFPKS